MEGTYEDAFRPTHFAAWPAEPPELPTVLRYELHYNREADRLEYPPVEPAEPLADADWDEADSAAHLKPHPRLPHTLPSQPGESRDEVMRWAAVKVARAEARRERVAIPEDFCLRECMSVNPDDHEALAEFVMKWGRLSPVACDIGGSPMASVCDGTWFAGPIRDPHRRAAVDDISSYEIQDGFPLLLESHYLHRLRSLVNHYLAYLRDEACADAWLDEGFACGAGEWGAWMIWRASMDAALHPFSYRVEIFTGPESRSSSGPDVSFYEVAVLQLLKVVTAGRSIRTCANERCEQVFTRQRGRTRYRNSGHDTGVLYCSHRCAKATAERARRARKKAARETGGTHA